MEIPVRSSPRHWHRSVSDAEGVTANLCKEKKKTSSIYIAAAIPATVALLILGILCFSYKRRISKWLKPKPHEGSNLPHRTSKFQFAYKDIVEATNGFRTKLGEGGYGHVSYGRLANGKEIAVKVQSSPHQGFKEFSSEVEAFAVINHKNIVPFLGYCMQDSQLILVYAYMPNGSLRDRLYDSTATSLSWMQRLTIALGAAEGLDYLHSKCVPGIIHRDVKSSNILLDGELVAKVADFGISKTYEHSHQTHITTEVKGTFGYLDPEYHLTGMLTQKSDVFSFGVVLFEIICAKPVRQGQENLTKWAREKIHENKLEEIVDTKMTGNYDMNSVWKLVEVAMACIEQESTRRPTMRSVVTSLEEAIAFTPPMETIMSPGTMSLSMKAR